MKAINALPTAFTHSLLMAIIALAPVAVSARTAPLQQACPGTIDRHRVYSPQLGDTIDIDIWTPPGYAGGGEAYPVMYMHDGQNLFDASTTWNHQAWEVDSVAGRLMADGIIRAPIVVGIHSDAASRIATLMPAKAVAGLNLSAGEFASLMGGMPPRGDEYVDFIASTVKPMVDSLYRTLPDRANTTVAGSSMGGLMSIYALCERPETFGNAICMSTHWSGTPDTADDFARALREYVAGKLPTVAEASAAGHVPRLYFDHGTATVDAEYGPYESQFIEMLRGKGYGPAHLMTYVDDGAHHEESAWSARLHLPLTFIFHR